MADPTPELTAETRAELLCVAVPLGSSRGFHEDSIVEHIRQAEAAATRQAFKQAAEMAVKRADLLRHNRDLCAVGGRAALDCFSEDLRELAKEQTR